jgi:hypothetical protein
MGYCRFQNTFADLKDCSDHLDDNDLSMDEKQARSELIKLMELLVEQYGEADYPEEIFPMGYDYPE